jgi:hypothetical protein
MTNKVRYTNDELTMIWRLYEANILPVEIPEVVNHEIHNGENIRSERSIKYALWLIKNDPRCLDLDE